MFSRKLFRSILVAAAMIFWLAGSVTARSTPSAGAPEPLALIAGNYQGTAETSHAVQKVRCELHVYRGDLYGTLRVGDYFYEVTSAVVSGDTLTLYVKVDGSLVEIVGNFADGSFEADNETFGTITMSRIFK